MIIAGDRENGEEYLARIVDDRAHGHDPQLHPIVLILRAVRYPNQRAIACPEIAMEFPPIASGTMCRMDVIREPTEGERALFAHSPEEALALARTRAMADARSDQEREILRRHAAGEYGRRRVIVKFSSYDIDYIQKYSKDGSAWTT